VRNTLLKVYTTQILNRMKWARQRMSADAKRMPSLACLPINCSWFWKTDFPTVPVRDIDKLVSETIIPLNNNSCNFILNVAPNRDGLIDENALEGLKKIGKLWKNEGATVKLAPLDLPITASNIALKQAANSSWSSDMDIIDFANDDDYHSSWHSNPAVKKPWLELDFKNEKGFNTIVVAEQKANIKSYRLDYWDGAAWKELFNGENLSQIKVHRFNTVWGSKVRIQIETFAETPSIAEFQVFNERR